MTPRSIRRAQERKARKQMQRKANLTAESHATLQAAEPTVTPEAQLPSSESSARRPRRPVTSESLCWNHEPLDDSLNEPILFTPAPMTAVQLAANRANAQLSTGPASPEGKAVSSLNAVKTALTGRTVLLPTDDASAYENHLRDYTEDFRPIGIRESDLVQSIADTAWRLKRIPCLESALFAQGHIEFAAAFNDHDPSLRASMIEVQTFIKYEKQLRNLQLQESRLVRRREKELAELRQLQQERKSRENEALETVAKLYVQAKQSNQPFEPILDGFVFSTAQIEAHLQRAEARNKARFAPAQTSGQQAA